MAEKRRPGRPTKYSQELADKICERMISGESLRHICADPDMPVKSTVLLWASKHEEFADQYTRARALLMDHWADEIIDIADDGTNDFVEQERENGNKRIVADHEHIHRSKLRVDTRKWLMTKIAPKRYGERVALTGGDGGPISVELVQFSEDDTE